MFAAPVFLTALLAASSIAAPSFSKRAVHVVNVGADNKLIFEPNAIFADVGDEVQFVFQSKNHSVVQSSLAAPCSPKADPGFNSGFQFVAAGTTEDKLPVVKYTVNTPKDQPLWFYCAQAAHTPNSHCAAGMLFSINCGATGSDTSFEKFQELAKNDPAATAPVADTPAPTNTDVITPLAPEPTYTGITVPPLTPAQTKTDVIVLGTSTWTTTYASYPGSPDPTPNSENGNEIKVIVGKDNTLTFDPPYVEAKPRDRIVFEFQSKNHTVTESSFASPCTPFFTAQGVAGIDSGFMPVTAGQTNPTFTVTVNDTTPLYFYCRQPGHCGKGMVFAVNTDEKGARSSTAFQTLAKGINGTSDGAPTAGNGSNSPGDGAAVLGVHAGGLTLTALVAFVATLVL